jgi:hypothetical protein
MKTVIFGLIASIAIALPAVAVEASAHGPGAQGKDQQGISAKARASYAYAPRQHRRHSIGIRSGQNAHLRQTDDPHSYGRPDRP